MTLVDEAREIRLRIEARMRELEPYLHEYEELRTAVGALEAPLLATGSGPSAAPRTPLSAVPAAGPLPASLTGPTAVPTPEEDRAGTSRSRQRRAAGELRREILDAVHDQPGGTVAIYATQLGVSAAVLYRPVRELTDEGALIKRGRQLLPA